MQSKQMAAAGVFLAALLHAQGRTGWITFGADPQRTGWNRTEDELTPDNVKNLKLQWSVKLDIQPKALNGLTVPLVRANIQAPKGIKDLVIVAGASDEVYVVEGDTGKIYWQKKLTVDGSPQCTESWCARMD